MCTPCQGLLAEAFPRATIIGYDYHEPSIVAATAAAKKKGLTNVVFELSDAQTFGEPGQFDVIGFFDCFHDMSVVRCRHVSEGLCSEVPFTIKFNCQKSLLTNAVSWCINNVTVCN